MTLLLVIISVVCFICISSTEDNNSHNATNVLCDKNTSSADSISLPMIGFGTAGLRQLTHEIVWKALVLGVRLVDTAQAAEWYDEEGVGTAVSEFQQRFGERVYLVTKIHPRSFGLDAMDARLTKSKVNLFTTQLDAVILHAPHCWSGHCTDEELQITWQTGWNNLELLKSKHGIALIGVSNFDYRLLLELEKISICPDTTGVQLIQNWMDPFHQDKIVREYAERHSIPYMAYSSLGTQWLGRRGITANPVLTNPQLLAIAKKHDTTVPRVVLSWLSVERVIAIPRSSSERHLNENFQHMNSSLMAVDEDGESSAVAAAGRSSLPLLDAEDLQVIRSLDGTMGNPWD